MSPAARGQPDIGDYALVGDGRTAALIDSGGSLDWMCFPHFDSPPVFTKLLDPEGGRFVIAVENGESIERRYRPGTASHEIHWETPTGSATAVDAMVLDVRRVLPQALLVRQVRCDEGVVTCRVVFDPREGWNRRRPTVERRSGVLIARCGTTSITFVSDPPLQPELGADITVRLDAGRALTVVVGLDERGPAILTPPLVALEALAATEREWIAWSSGLRYEGPARELVERSAITLRLLTFAPSGAPVAAPTTSLPELIGSTSNWDYRFAWPRDASIGASAFAQLGRPEEGERFFYWTLHAGRRTRPELDVLYDVFGGTDTKELEVDVPGYMASRPVRVGNAAATQFQLDVYGWVVDAAWNLHRLGRPISRAVWRTVQGYADVAARRWDQPDHGIWELREEPRQYVHGKVMAWLALDRAIRMSGALPTKAARVRGWADARAALGADVERVGWDAERLGYRMAYGDDRTDAALLVLPLVGLHERDDPRVLRTIRRIQRELDAGTPLVYRHLPADGRPREGAFLPCSFWLAQALAAVGEHEEAVETFEAMCGLATPLGLFAEEMDPASGTHVGNFPQALTHAALIQAALALTEPSALGMHEGAEHRAVDDVRQHADGRRRGAVPQPEEPRGL
jgi:GH15 family glucan-1,4-alpha-glucosidase